MVKVSKEVMKPREAAEYLEISKVTLYKLLNSGEIPAKKIGKQWRISKAVLDRFLAGGKEKLSPLNISLSKRQRRGLLLRLKSLR